MYEPITLTKCHGAKKQKGINRLYLSVPERKQKKTKQNKTNKRTKKQTNKQTKHSSLKPKIYVSAQ